MSTRLDAPITAVTVYPGQARVTRRATVTAAEGEQRVVVGGLPRDLHPDSVRVSGHGPATVLGVDVRPERNPRTQDAALGELEERRDALQRAQADQADRLTVLDTRLEVLNAMARRTSATFAQALARDEAAPGRVAEVGAALAEQLTDAHRQRREVVESIRRTQEELDEAERRLADRRQVGEPDNTAVEVDLAATAAAEVELEVSYLVDSANWESRYDIRLSAETLSLTWYGLVTQYSGEDWPECDLRLSTARPAHGVDVPELSPWYLDALKPVPPPAPRASASRAGFGAAAPMAAPAGVPLGYSAAPIAESYAVAEQGAAATTYRPSRPIAVPADGTAHRTTVTAIELPASVDHVTVPLRGPEAYLRAKVTNNSEHTLRAGRASIFHDAEFVGVTNLAVWAPGEEVELALGIDDRVRVERDLVKRSAGKAVLGGTRREEATYRIKVGNFGPHRSKITVVDQVPVSRSEAIVVRDVVVKPQPSEQTDLGELTWALDVPAGETAEITIGFRVDVAKGTTLAGWRD
ncbi:mucoidy inhibitor MuiA family protein [Actinokineospora auranticolor]|uniref:Uncharacterized protein (TIGR02231 family) n=1 Tax=Actinokineospora auranticolor TaxID=155976 RepID=A0A2S6GC75_9PSEU|nr:mucoidy inhibitor MuiA family protein [Actinokineospora auranticolor]PPK62206.1 uncharacterized protein (TIGR02231 family) [Actinokineospora auranticolor]